MDYRNLKSIINALPIEEWVKTDIKMSVDDFLKEKLQRWLELLETDGIDSKNMVATDIQKLLEEIKNEKKFNI